MLIHCFSCRDSAPECCVRVRFVWIRHCLGILYTLRHHRWPAVHLTISLLTFSLLSHYLTYHFLTSLYITISLLTFSLPHKITISLAHMYGYGLSGSATALAFMTPFPTPQRVHHPRWAFDPRRVPSSGGGTSPPWMTSRACTIIGADLPLNVCLPLVERHHRILGSPPLMHHRYGGDLHKGSPPVASYPANFKHCGLHVFCTAGEMHSTQISYFNLPKKIWMTFFISFVIYT